MQRLVSLWQDLRVAVRHLAKTPGATALSVLSIALGIGLTTGIFSVVDAHYLRPLPIERPREVLYVSSHAEAGKDLVTLVAYQRRASQLAGEDENLLVLTNPVTPNYFSMLGVRAQVGAASVDPADGRPRAVLGFQLWQRRFRGDPQIVGKTILLNKKAFLVAGVMPRAFPGLVRGITTDIWMSVDAWFTVFGQTGDQKSRHGQFELVARLKPGVSAARAAAVLDAAIRGEGKHKPAPAGVAGTFLQSPFALNWQDSLTYGGGLLLILGAILFVACANVAQLRLAQAETRKKELGVRMALGAGGWRITRQLLVETGLLSLVGAGTGMVLAQSLMGKIAQFMAAGRVYVDYDIRLDYRVLGYTLAAVLLSVLLT